MTSQPTGNSYIYMWIQNVQELYFLSSIIDRIKSIRNRNEKEKNK